MAISGGARPVPEPGLTVSAVAHRLGIAASTLRTWDRRYGLGPSGHLAGSHRRFAPADLERLMDMRRLTLDGVPPALAARIVLSGASPCPRPPRNGRGPDERPPPPGPVPVTIGSPRDGPPPAGGAPARPCHDRPGRGRGVPGPAARTRREPEPPEPASAARARSGGVTAGTAPDRRAARVLARAARSLDSQEIARIFRSAVREHGTVRAWEQLAVPVFRTLGDRWRATAGGVETEHVFTEAVLGVLRGTAAELHRPLDVRPVLLGCVAGDRHTVPLHCLAAALAERRVTCRVMGSGVPDDALVSAVRRCGPAVLFLHARMPVTGTDVLARLSRRRPAPALVVGGCGWAASPPAPGVVVVSSLPEAVSRVMTSLELSESAVK